MKMFITAYKSAALASYQGWTVSKNPQGSWTTIKIFGVHKGGRSSIEDGTTAKILLDEKRFNVFDHEFEMLDNEFYSR